jgi:hypothetical protein
MGGQADYPVTLRREYRYPTVVLWFLRSVRWLCSRPRRGEQGRGHAHPGANGVRPLFSR